MSEGALVATWVMAAVAAPLVVALVVMCLREPMRVALPIFAALIPFGGGLSIGDSKYTSLSSLAGMLLGAGLALQLLTARRAAPRLSPMVPVWLLFLATASATVLWSVERSKSIETLVVLVSVVLVFVLAALSEADRSIIRRTENGLLFGGVAVVCYGLYQLVVLGGFPDDKPGSAGVAVTGGRFGNDLLDPNLQAIALLLPLAVSLSRAFGENRRSARLLNAMIAALMLWGVLMTGSRAGTLAVGVVVVAQVVSGPRSARRGLLGALAAGLALAALVWVYHPAGIAERRSLDSASATSSSGRTDIWRVGLTACADYCAQGSGWGTFPEVYGRTQASVPGARVLSGRDGTYQPHNLWLGVAVELGVTGLLLLVAGLVTSVSEAVRIPADRRGPPFSTVVALWFAVMFVSSIEFKFFWMILIMVALHRNLTAAERRQELHAAETVSGQVVR